MESKEALKDIFGILINFERLSGIQDKRDIKKQKFDIVEKDLDRLEKLEKAFDIITTKNVDIKTIKTCCGTFAYAAYNSGRVPRSVHPAEHRFSTAGAAAPVARAQSYPANVVFLPERTLHPAETGQAAQWLLFASFPRSEC